MDLPMNNAPHPFDVFLGRGNAVAQHYGTQLYRRKVIENKERYLKVKGHKPKEKIAQEVIDFFTTMEVVFIT